MANIVITNRCNLRCPYCFAEEKIQDNEQYITISQLNEIMEFLKRSNEGRIGIIGGEPLLHPDIKNILKELNNFIRDNKMTSVIFTNGIHLDELIPYIGERIRLTININHPDSMSNDNSKKIKNTLEHLHELDWFLSGKANIGVNIYHELDDYTFIYDIIKRYRIPRVRTSFVSPTYGKHASDKEKYFIAAVPKFVEYCSKLLELGAKVGQDCSFIPSCYFTEEELDIVISATDLPEGVTNIDKVCEPVCDITPDYKVIPCFGTYEEIDMMMFENMKEIRRYIQLRKLFPLMEKNKTGRCLECHKFQFCQCQGGCLAFAKLNI